MKNAIIRCFFLLSLASCLVTHQPKHANAEIIAGMNTYDSLLQKMDGNSISLLYAPDGELGDVAKGRDSIRRFLKKFAEFKVLSNRSVTDSVKMSGDSALQKGVYTQVTILPSKDTAHLTGQFESHWIWLPKEGWKIKKMITKPSN